MKKVLFVITKSNWGGAQRYVYDLATNLDLEQFEVAVACGGEGILKSKLESRNIQVLGVKAFQRDIHFLRELAAFKELLHIFRNKPDIVHLNSSKAGGLGALAARISGVPKVIFTAHGWPFKEERPLLIKWAIYLMTWFTVLLSHKTIVVSREDKRLGEKMWFVDKKIEYIPIGLSTVNELFEKEQAEKILFWPDPNVDLHIINSVRLVTIAELTRNKGLSYGIDMMKQLEATHPSKYTYTIFGEGEELYNLQQQSNNLLNQQDLPIVLFRNIETIRSGFRKLSNLSTEASRYLRAFHIFVLPSIKEGMPYVLLEAAAAGLPIVATNAVASAASEIPNLHIVSSGSGSELAKKVLEISTQFENISEEKLKSNFSLEKMVAKTIDLYGAA